MSEFYESTEKSVVEENNVYEYEKLEVVGEFKPVKTGKFTKNKNS
jgi:hypothetical protein